MTAPATLGGAFAAARAKHDRSYRPASAAPETWDDWLRDLFPSYVSANFGARHVAFWDWLWGIELDSSPDPFIGIWPRGGAKTTSAELGTVAVGCRRKRRYVLYVRGTQDRADDSVQTIANLLESERVGRYYPEHSDRKVSKFGSARGWRRNRLITAGGFIVDAFGLDTTARGVKMDEQRPDLIVFDDIDAKLDTPQTTAKKIATITTSLLPAGANNAGALGIQNLIIPNGFFARMAGGRADYLARRIVSGPHPAIEGLEYEMRPQEGSDVLVPVITGGTATWEGQPLEICQRQMHEWGLSAFLKEAQHDVLGRAEGLALRFQESRHLETLTDDECRQLVRYKQPFGGIDFGSWRFAFTLRAVDLKGVPHQIAEYFAQKGATQNHDTHAKAIHAICEHYGCPHGLKVWGDAANAQDITELNRAFARIGSPYRVMAVAQANKQRKTSVDRLNDLLDKNGIKYRRNVRAAVAEILTTVEWPNPQDPNGPPVRRPRSDFLTWQLGMTAVSAGETTEGSRLVWEVQHWAYPVPIEGKSQDQDPDDHTADGADTIASDRYAIMSWWRPGKDPTPEKDVSAFDPAVLQAEAQRTRTLKHRVRRKPSHDRPIDDHFGEY